MTHVLEFQGQRLVQGEDGCCSCTGKGDVGGDVAMKTSLLIYKTALGENDTMAATVTPVTPQPGGRATPLVPSYPLPPGGERCLVVVYFL